MFARKHAPASFAAATAGSVAPIFGLCIMMMMALMGMTVDGSRATSIATDAGTALDAAALAAAKTLRLENPTDAEIDLLAQQYFSANFAPIAEGAVTLLELTTTPDRTTNTIRIVAKLRIPTPIASVIGHHHVDVSLSATAVFEAKDVELAMMLDLSGSMWGGKLADLKASAKDLVDILLPHSTHSDHRIAIAPFATAVNAGSLAGLVSRGQEDNGAAQAGRDTSCVTERSGTRALTDGPPAADLLNRKSASCPSSAVMPLTGDADALKGAIDSMQADGMTAGHLGIAWAWYLLSPEWASIYPTDSEPADYADEKVRKVALIMTDGMFNSHYETANGDSIEQARRLCDNMKDANVTIYTVGFQVPGDVVPTLQYCASTPTHYYSAENGAELKSTFRLIANQLNGLRLAS